ncbi:MAG: nucleotide-binding protein [Ignavibacteriales bacterium]|nr:nucleotide-binding protein [Ignavibacteriales bacterium]
MDQQNVSKLQELIQQGEKLVPEGGLEFSGYNAKMQSQYLLWRKNCLDALSKIGEKANPHREKITKDENGAYFYQNSAQLILEMMKQSLPIAEIEAKKNSTPPSAPKPAPAPAPPKAEPAPAPAQPKAAPQPAPPAPKQEAAKPQPAAVPPPAPVTPSAASKQVLVLSSSETELKNQLTNLLKEMGIEGIMFQRGDAPDAIVGFLEKYPTVKYAYYLYNPEDINSAMFELGYLIGKVGSTRVCCIHKKDDAPPKGVPGIVYKEIVVKLEEISFGLIKDLKAAGYTVTF